MKLFQKGKQQTAYKKPQRKKAGSKSANVQADTTEQNNNQNQEDICTHCVKKKSSLMLCNGNNGYSASRVRISAMGNVQLWRKMNAYAITACTKVVVIYKIKFCNHNF
jgi:hypothetical protein